MNLIIKIEEFFIEYDKHDRNVEEYISLLLPILHSLADDLNESQRQKINSICAFLESDLDDIKDLVSARDKESIERLKEIRTKVRTNIHDFRHGDILKTFREKSSGKPAETSFTQPSPAPNLPGERGQGSPPKQPQFEEDRLAKNGSGNS